MKKNSYSLLASKDNSGQGSLKRKDGNINGKEHDIDQKSRKDVLSSDFVSAQPTLPMPRQDVGSDTNDRRHVRRRLPPEFRVSELPTRTNINQDVSSVSTTQPLNLSNELESPKVASEESKRRHKKQHTLEMFAIDHFRPPRKRSLSNSLRIRPIDRVWSHTRKPIKKPLLKTVLDSPDLAEEACIAFEYIMKYMGDIPTESKRRLGTELTDYIYRGALVSDTLKDEIYCQLVKQLTNNRHGKSEERGWELMWLVTGIFACSQTVMTEVTKFLQTARNQLAVGCIQRLENTNRVGQRKYPPHEVEIDAIQQKITNISHKVFLPDDTYEAFDVSPDLKTRDVCLAIGQRLQLKSSEGFGLFIRFANKVISVPEEDFFFDAVRQFTDLMTRKARSNNEDSTSALTYQVLFMKKLWTNTIPGEDPIADTRFHYYQEIPKLRRGYHKCSKDDAAELAALQYRLRFAEDTPEFQNIPGRLKELLPADLVRTLSAEQWKRNIVAAYKKHATISEDEVKIAFLNTLYRLPTFGSAFFEVKQKSVSGVSDFMLVAINKHGVNFMDPRTKETLETYPFAEITNWGSTNTHFHVTIRNRVREFNVQLETSLAHKLDDLLTSYTRQIRGNTKSCEEAGDTEQSTSMT